jgi:hypothetical protein
MKKYSYQYGQIKHKYMQMAQQMHQDFIVDALGEDVEKQLRYEAACTSLKEIKKDIDSMASGNMRDQFLLFYDEKLRQLQERANEHEATPYTL